MATKWIKNELAKEYIIKLKEHYLGADYNGSCIMLGNGTAKFKLEGTNSILLQLKDNLKLNKNVPFRETESALYKSIDKCAENHNWNFNYLSEKIKNIESEYLHQPKKTFILLSRYNFMYFKGIKPIQINNCIIKFYKKRPNNFEFPDQNEIDNFQFSYGTHEWSHSVYVSIKVLARNNSDAMSMANNALNLFRGFINFYYLMDNRSRHSNYKIDPINKIFVGPYLTIHHENGSLSSKYIFNGIFAGKPQIENISIDEYKEVLKFYNSLKSTFSKSGNKWRFYKTIYDLNQAFDYDEMELVIVKLWSILEDLVDINHANYDLLVNRVSSAFKDKVAIKEKLTTFRNLRNNIVHNGPIKYNLEEMAYKLKAIVINFFIFIINTSIDFKKYDDLLETLEISPNNDSLKKLVEQTKKLKNNIKLNETKIKYLKKILKNDNN